MRRQSSTVVSATNLPCLLSCASPQAGEDERSPSDSPKSARRQAPTPESPFSGGSTHSALGGLIKTKDEARFFTYYIRNLSPWVDICDTNNHFANEVPRRALHVPLLAYSLIAVASRQLSFISSIGNVDPAVYYSQALGLLIAKLSGPVEDLDENILAALILLRTYEEVTGRLGSMSVRDAMTVEQDPSDDTATHLSGVTQLLNSVSNFMGKGGLGEAASWIVLRQDMYFSLTRSHPLRTHLDCYTASTSFIEDSPESIANRIVLIGAKIQTHAFGPAGRATVQQWDQLRAEAEAWFESRPWDFRPMWVEDGGVFPSAWLHQPILVMGYQQYYLCLMLLAIFDPRLWEPGFESFRQRRITDEIVHENVRLIMGLAISNPSGMSNRFLASHTLQACGTYLTDPEEQKEALKFLNEVETQCGWRTKPVVDKLVAAWSRT